MLNTVSPSGFSSEKAGVYGVLSFGPGSQIEKVIVNHGQTGSNEQWK